MYFTYSRTTSQVNMVFKRFCKKYDIINYDVNQYLLRHIFATRCIEAGMQANVLSKIMGHANLRTTLEVYCDVFSNYEKEHTNKTFEYLKQNNLLITALYVVIFLYCNTYCNAEIFNDICIHLKIY